MDSSSAERAASVASDLTAGDAQRKSEAVERAAGIIAAGVAADWPSEEIAAEVIAALTGGEAQS